jgi:hypothetical protein
MATISRKVLTRYLKAQVQAPEDMEEETQNLWDDAVEKLPKSLQKHFGKPKSDDKSGHGDYTQSLEFEFYLDGDKDVGLYLKVSKTVGEDADEDGAYGYRDEAVEYWMTCLLYTSPSPRD